MKKILESLWIFAVVVAACVILNPTKAYAASVDDLTFELNSDGASYSVTGCERTAGGALSIPSYYNNKPVTAIADYAFQSCTNLTSVNIGNIITTIGDYAFSFCYNITSVTIPNTVTTIGDNAFCYCESLISVTFGSSVATIGDDAFSYCKSLSNISFPISLTAIGDYAFYGCDSLINVSIPYRVTTIGCMAFSGCDSLYGAIIANCAADIGNSAFSNCAKLTNLSLGNKLTGIGQGAFSGCKSLTSVTIPDSVTTIGGTAFYDCDSLASVTIGNGVTTIGDGAFCYCENLTSVNIPESVTTIGDSAFSHCTSLTGVTIPKNVTAISESAFSGCEALTSVTIPDSVTAIGDYAFNNCYSLTDLTIGNGVTTIGNNAFYYCFKLPSVTIPENVTTIGDSAFRYCSDLTDVYYGGTQEQWYGLAIGANNDPLLKANLHCADPCADGHTEEIIPGKAPTETETGLTEGKKCSVCGEILIAQEVLPVLPAAEVTDGYLNLKLNADATGYYVASCSFSVSGTVVIPAAVNGLPVVAVGDNAFKNCGGLTGVSIPGSVTSIGDHAFYNCDKLAKITVPEGVTAIGPYGISYCDALKEINLPSTLVTIDNNAFAYDKVLVTMTIPEGVTTIGDNAFRYCKRMASISLPATLTSFGYKVFSACDVLATIQVAEGNSVFFSDDSNVLYGENMTKLIWAGTGLAGKYVIPSGVLRIEDFAFYNCSGLTDVVIPDSLTYIGESAFSGCSGVKTVTMGVGVATICKEAFRSCTSMTDVYYNGIQEQWNRISVAEYNEPLLNAVLHLSNFCAEGHTYDHDFDPSCNVCGEERKLTNTFQFENYRVAFSDGNADHKNQRVVVYKLGNSTVEDPTNENALKAIDANAETYWGASHINKICITDAGNYVLLLKYNVGTAAATKVPMEVSVSAAPKLTIDKNNKITVHENDATNLYHRVNVYYLGDQTIENIYDEAALMAFDPEAKTVWNIRDINRIALTKGGNYVLHLCYNKAGSNKIVVAQQFNVFSIPSVSVNNNNMLVAIEENSENRNHRATVFFLGEGTVEDPYDEAAVKAAALTTSKTYWGMKEINSIELKEGGNYVIHLYYNVGTSEKRTLALDVTLNERPALRVDEDNRLVVTYADPEINNPRAYIYKVDDAAVADIYDEAALKKIATPTQVWGLSSINKKTLTPGTYVIHLYYSVGTSAKKTVAIQVTI